MKKVFFVAGDPSGDKYAGYLAKALKKSLPNLEVHAAGGKYLKDESQTFINLTELAITGILEVGGNLLKIIEVFQKTKEAIFALKPDLVILVDFPDFNLRLAKAVKAKGFKIAYYISPQVWAWRKKRINLIKKYVDKMLVIFPFEKEFYQEAGIDAEYVGHPLADLLKDLEPVDIYQEFNLSPQKPLVVLLPGSRQNEVKRHLEVMLKAKDILSRKNHNLQFALIKATNLPPSLFARAKDMPLISRYAYQTIKESALAVSSSGTATFELLLLETPAVVIYRLNYLSYLLLKPLVKVPYISMANLILKKRAFVELIQNQACGEKIAQAAESILNNPEQTSHLRQELANAKEIFFGISHFSYTAEKLKSMLA